MKIKDILKDRRLQLGYTLDDIARMVGVSGATVSRWESGDIANMRRDKIAKLAEALQISPSVIMGWEEHNADSKHHGKIKQAPVLGCVAAGEPLFAAENIDGYIDIPTSWKGEHFGLVIKGRSMEPRIMDDDIVVVRKQDDVDSGKVAVVIINGEEATVKRVIKSDAGITLVGNNSQVYTPQFYTVEDVKGLPVQIIGEVIEVRGKP